MPWPFCEAYKERKIFFSFLIAFSFVICIAEFEIRGDGSWARQFGADQAVQADALFSRFDGKRTVDFRRNPDDESSAK
jgi:hypothetical protein